MQFLIFLLISGDCSLLSPPQIRPCIIYSVRFLFGCLIEKKHFVEVFQYGINGNFAQ